MPPKKKAKAVLSTERKEGNNDASTLDTPSATKNVAPLETPFDANLFLQQGRNRLATPNQSVFHLTVASVAAAAAFNAPAPPVLSLPPVPFVVPELTNSSTFSTLSRVPETPTPHIKQVVSLRAAVTPTTVPSAQFNLSMMAFSDSTIRSIIKTCMKDHIFPKCKFYHRDKHGAYDRSPTSMCGQIMKHCSLEADAKWWYQIRTVVVKTHTDHRNNCIKRLNARFKGMYKQCVCIRIYLLTYLLFSQFERTVGVPNV